MSIRVLTTGLGFSRAVASRAWRLDEGIVPCNFIASAGSSCRTVYRGLALALLLSTRALLWRRFQPCVSDFTTSRASALEPSERKAGSCSALSAFCARSCVVGVDRQDSSRSEPRLSDRFACAPPHATRRRRASPTTCGRRHARSWWTLGW